MRAAMLGQEGTGRLLITAGANLSTANGAQKWTPLHWAAFSGSHALAEALLLAGADAEANPGGGLDPKGLAMHYGHDHIVELLDAHLEKSGE